MKLALGLLLLLSTAQLSAQNYSITNITVALQTNPDANTANWKSGTSTLMITAMAKAGSGGRIDPVLESSRILVTIKGSGGKVCGSYTSQTAPSAGFNSLNKVWSGANAVGLLGQDCILGPGEYELCVQFFGNGPTGVMAQSEEKCKLFSIRGAEQQVYQPPQLLMPANETKFSEADAVKPVTFRWLQVMPAMREPLTYRLRVWQLRPGQKAPQAIAVNTPVVSKDVENSTQTTVQLLRHDPDQLDDEFVWNVEALNRDGKPVGLNKGTSEVFTFRRMHKPFVVTKEWGEAIILVSPVNDAPIRIGKPIIFEWKLKPDVVLPPGSLYKIKIVEVKEDQTIQQAFKGNKPFFEKDSLKEMGFQYPSGGPGFEEGKRYAWAVEAKEEAGVKITESDINEFIIISNGCPRKSADWTTIAYELNKISHCKVDQFACKAYTDTVTKQTYYLWPGEFPLVYSIANQNKIMADAKSWALYMRPMGCGGYKSIISITYSMAPQGNSVGISILYGCCTGGHNQQQSIALISPANGSGIKPGELPEFKWSVKGVPGPLTYKLRIIALKEGRSEEEALQSNKPYFEKNLKELTFQYPSSAPKLNSGSKYLWDVQMSNQEGEFIDASELFGFSIHDERTTATLCRCGAWKSISVDNGFGNSLFYDCGKDIEWNCKRPFTFGSTYVCSPSSENCYAKISWTVTKDGSSYSSGNTPGGTFNPTENGVYTLTLNAECGSSKCAPCIYRVVVKDCIADTCVCGKWTPLSIKNPTNNTKYACGSKIAWKCNKPLKFATSYTCNARDKKCQAETDWKITKGGLTIKTGTGANSIGDEFTPAANGTYIITLNASCNGIKCTPCTYTIIVKDCKTEGTICGGKFNDLNGNGKRDNGEPGLPNWLIKLSGTKSASILTDEKGKYCFTGLKPGNYVVSETNKPGWVQTSPDPSTFTITLAAGQTVNDMEFGNYLLPDPCSEIALCNTGFEQFTPVPGELLQLYGYDIIPEANVSCWKTTAADKLIELHLGGQLLPAYSGNYFVEVNANEMSTLYQSLNITGSVAITVKFAHRGRYAGVDQMEVLIADPSGVPVHSFGTYSANNTAWIYNTTQPFLINTPPGSYTLQFKSISSNNGTGPADGGNFLDAVSVTCTPAGSICGTKFNDLNANGIRDNDEPGLPKWQIDLAGSVERSTYTDEQGNYCFNELPPGAYKLGEQNQPGWHQTTPSQGVYNISLNASQNITNKDFGNTFDFCTGTKTWKPLGTGVNGKIFALAHMGTDLYAGGEFTSAGGVSANKIAKWNGTQWSALGTGLGGPVGTVHAIATDGINLYVGGEFTNAGGITANHVAKWNGTQWSALGNGVNGTVDAIKIIGTDVYVGGLFTTASGLPAKNIAKWNGSAWVAIGNGFNGGVRAIEPIGGFLYVGGISASPSGNNPTPSLAKWNGSAWLNATNGGMLTDAVDALLVIGSDLYVGGWFTQPWGANRVVKWNGTNVSLVGSGVNNGHVDALVTMGSGIYASGAFNSAGGVVVSNVAKWNGTNWAALGAGIAGHVEALEVIGADIYAAGSFTTAGGVTVNNITKYSCSSSKK